MQGGWGGAVEEVGMLRGGGFPLNQNRSFKVSRFPSFNALELQVFKFSKFQIWNFRSFKDSKTHLVFVGRYWSLITEFPFHVFRRILLQCYQNAMFFKGIDSILTNSHFMFLERYWYPIQDFQKTFHDFWKIFGFDFQILDISRNDIVSIDLFLELLFEVSWCLQR